MIIRCGTTERLERALENVSVPGEDRILWAVGADAYGPDASFYQEVRRLRQASGCASSNLLTGCIGSIVVDAAGELYTKQIAQDLVLAASMAGCTFPGKALIEGTGSLYNQHILAEQMGLGPEETYFRRVEELAARLNTWEPPHFQEPKILMIHACEHATSNTLWLGHRVAQELDPRISIREISLRNGTIQDCRGCGYTACLHYAQNSSCFYGGYLSEEVLPAIEESDAILFLCPNYNDALSANITALINRMTNLLLRADLSRKYLFGIIVSGYSGGDLVARQLLGAMSLNKQVILAPEFAMLETANDPLSIRDASGIGERITAYAEHIGDVLTGAGDLLEN